MSDARENARIPSEEEHRGHDIGDRDATGPSRDREAPASGSTDVTRTSRGGSEPDRDRTAVRRDDDNRDPIPGNTSETGVGSPVADGTAGRPPGTTPIRPPMGCGRPAAMILMFTVASVTIAQRLLKN